MGHIRGLLEKLMPVLKLVGAAMALVACAFAVYLGAVLLSPLGMSALFP